MDAIGRTNEVDASTDERNAQIVSREDPLSIGRESFMQLLITQLRYQDPLSPMEDQDFIAQLAQLNTLEQLQTLNNSFELFMQQQNLMRGAELLGKTVQGLDGNGGTVQGTVESVSVRGGEVMLGVGDSRIALTDVTDIVE